jgi:hypothetical protein
VLAQSIHLDVPPLRDQCVASRGSSPDSPARLAPLQNRAPADHAADALDAFVSGDYQRAAEMLKPIAEAWSRRDHLAELFMATLYENGQGVPVDTVRACALYVRASFDPVNPIGLQAAALVHSLQGSSSPDEFRRCAGKYWFRSRVPAGHVHA